VKPRFHFRSLVLVPSYDCTARCAHCYPSCGPRSGRPWDSGFVERAIRGAARLPVEVLNRYVHFAGGEPFLYFAQLVKGLECARSHGFRSSVVTNGFWAVSERAAEAKVRALVPLGLKRVELSVDTFHQEFVPLTRIRVLLRVLRRFGLEIFLRTVTTVRRDAWSAIAGIPLEELVGTMLVASPVSPAGRALDTIPESEFLYSRNLDGCCFRQLNLTVRFDGNVSPCCAGSDTVPALSLGNIHRESYEEIVARLPYQFHLRALFCQGPMALAKALKAGGLGSKLKPRYVSMCHMCGEFFSDPEIVDWLTRHYRRLNAARLVSYLSRAGARFKQGSRPKRV
jgi:MoaA/NifB/PqqE/SkfB family radical SAM enzyme